MDPLSNRRRTTMNRRRATNRTRKMVTAVKTNLRKPILGVVPTATIGKEYDPETLHIRMEREISTIAVSDLQSYWSTHCNYHENSMGKMIPIPSYHLGSKGTTHKTRKTLGGAKVGTGTHSLVRIGREYYNQFTTFLRVFSNERSSQRKTVISRIEYVLAFSTFMKELMNTNPAILQKKPKIHVNEETEYMDAINQFILHNKHFKIDKYFQIVAMDTQERRRTSSHRKELMSRVLPVFTGDAEIVTHYKIYKGAGPSMEVSDETIYASSYQAYGTAWAAGEFKCWLRTADNDYNKDEMCIVIPHSEFVDRGRDTAVNDLRTQRMTLAILLYYILRVPYLFEDPVTAVHGDDPDGIIMMTIRKNLEKHEDQDILPLHALFNCNFSHSDTLCMFVDNIPSYGKEQINRLYSEITLGYLLQRTKRWNGVEGSPTSTVEHCTFSSNATNIRTSTSGSSILIEYPNTSQYYVYVTSNATISKCDGKPCHFSADYEKFDEHEIAEDSFPHFSHPMISTMVADKISTMVPDPTYLRNNYADIFIDASIMAQLSYYPTHNVIRFKVSEHIRHFGAYDPDPDFGEARVLHRIHVWIDTTNHHLFFVCRGTQSARDWRHPDRQISAGMGFESDRIDAIRNTLRKVHSDLKKDPKRGVDPDNYTLFTVGHSLGGFLANAAAIITYQNKVFHYTNTFTKAISLPFQPFYAAVASNNQQYWKMLNWGFQENVCFLLNVENDFAAENLVAAKKANKLSSNVCIFEIPRLKWQIPTLWQGYQQFLKGDSHCLFNYHGMKYLQPMLNNNTRYIMDTKGHVHDIEASSSTITKEMIMDSETHRETKIKKFRNVEFILPSTYNIRSRKPTVSRTPSLNISIIKA